MSSPSARERAATDTPFGLEVPAERKGVVACGLADVLPVMADHMLKDIGLRRCEIEYCVRYGRDG
jgi:hypothetical protein